MCYSEPTSAVILNFCCRLGSPGSFKKNPDIQDILIPKPIKSECLEREPDSSVVQIPGDSNVQPSLTCTVLHEGRVYSSRCYECCRKTALSSQSPMRIASVEETASSKIIFPSRGSPHLLTKQWWVTKARFFCYSGRQL